MKSGLPHRIPVSTYRLQFNRDFTFNRARELLPYLESLGITDIYSSPYFKAQPGSTHGYDVIDHNALSPEAGTREEYDELSRELRARGMGQVLDIVPNHMSIIGSGNKWWTDVLENGRSSPYAAFFDIDWKPLREALEDKVILPVLGGQYGYVLENQELRLVFHDGAFFVDYYEHRFPVDPSTYTQVLTYRAEALAEALGEDSADYREYQGIMAALRNLPHRTEENPAKVAERHREKEAAKSRLRSLYAGSEAFRKFIDENLGVFNGTKGEPHSFDLLDRLLSEQVYRLSFWRVATEEINYRRFFDINDLGAIRVEEHHVFDEAHRLVFDLIRSGSVTGLRVDHPDGLHNPAEYFTRLQEGCFVSLCRLRLGDDADGESIKNLYREELAEAPESPLRRPFYIVGEKILMDSERLQPDWPVYGTTGYCFLNSLNGVFVDSANAKALDKTYALFTREKPRFQDLLYGKKKLIMETTMSSEINVLGHRLNRISEKDRHYRDLTLNNLTDAIVEVIALFPVYRTYASPSGISERDSRYIEAAVSKAKRLARDINPLVYDFLRDVLLLRYPAERTGKLGENCLDFVMRFQQLTGPVMAKGLEDTVFYIYNRLVSLNEVGGNPERFGISAEAFHGHNIERNKNWPHTLITTSTHDCKRSEDVRARINVLSELSSEWRECLVRWSKMNRKFKSRVEGGLVPSRNEEYLLYQSLIGAWPIGGMDERGRGEFTERIRNYMVKAVREAKVNSSWLNPDTQYEDALGRFVQGVLGSEQFRSDFTVLRKKVEHYGIINSLAQTLLKVTSPGVPDFYQGTELWHQRLVDPDNRTPVDYSLRMELLAELKAMEEGMDRAALARRLLDTKEDGRIKLYLTCRALNFRKEHSDLFQCGEYVPVYCSGRHADRIIASGQRNESAVSLTVVPRLVTEVCGPDEQPLGDAWEDTSLQLPAELAGARYRNVLTDETLKSTERRGQHVLYVRDVLRSFPVALLEMEAP